MLPGGDDRWSRECRDAHKGALVSRDQRLLISWFGIRGIGSVYYLMFAVNRGVPEAIAHQLVGLTLALVATSIVVHGISVTPLMDFFARRKARDSGPPRG